MYETPHYKQSLQRCLYTSIQSEYGPYPVFSIAATF